VPNTHQPTQDRVRADDHRLKAGSIQHGIRGGIDERNSSTRVGALVDEAGWAVAWAAAERTQRPGGGGADAAPGRRRTVAGAVRAATERRMVGLNPELLEAEVLQVGHHRSQTSTDPEFLTLVSPAVAAYSAGAGNAYGHPNHEVLDRLVAADLELSASISMAAWSSPPTGSSGRW